MKAIAQKKPNGTGRMTASKVVALIKPFIDRNQPRDFHLVIRGARYSTAWKAWLVFVDVDREGASALDYVRRITDIQQQVEANASQIKVPIRVTVAGAPEVD